ncbi:MAG: XisI protein [Sphingobacteriales bacterium]|nr:XisI protein [Sphingobacteriales bacterium]
MDKIALYRKYIEEVMNVYGNETPAGKDVVYQQVFDRQNDHYYLMRIGWIGQTRIHNCVFHCDIINNKIWIQEDWTERGIANEFLERGITKPDIVLAFNPPYIRQIAGGAYAVE